MKLMVERQKRIQAESELEGYKEELKESFRVIVELRWVNNIRILSIIFVISTSIYNYLDNIAGFVTNRKLVPKDE